MTTLPEITPHEPPSAASAAAGPDRPTVLFLCVHNAGRSQMAAAWLAHLAGGRVKVLSGGSAPADAVNPVVVAAMAEVGIDIGRHAPRAWTDAEVRAADAVVTMGCGDACPYHPGRRYEDWPVHDPAGLDLPAVRRIRDEIEQRVRALMATLGIAPAPGGAVVDRAVG